MPSHKWTPAQRAKFIATMARKRERRKFQPNIKRVTTEETRPWKRTPKRVYVLHRGQLIKVRLRRVHAYVLEA